MNGASTAPARALLALALSSGLGACVEGHWDDDGDWDKSWWNEPDAGNLCPGCTSPDAGSSNPADAGGNSCPSTAEAVYVSHDPALCAILEFSCAEGMIEFSSSSCGCGCVPMGTPPPPPPPPPPPLCPDESDPGVWYLSHDGALCASLSFTCPAGQERFSESCGCGCVDHGGGAPDAGVSSPDAAVSEPDAAVSEPDAGAGAPDAAVSTPDAGETAHDAGSCDPPPPVCPDPNDPRVLYLGDSPAVCAVISYTCPAGCVAFSSPCGCGCIEMN